MQSTSQDVTVSTFPQIIIEGSKDKPVLVVFWSPQSSVCASLLPLLDKLHNEFGAKLLQRWKMSEKIVNVAKFHEEPEACNDFQTELNVINLSDHIASFFKYDICDKKVPEGVGANSENILNLLGLPSAKKLSVTKDMLSVIEEKLPENMRLLKNLI